MHHIFMHKGGVSKEKKKEKGKGGKERYAEKRKSFLKYLIVLCSEKNIWDTTTFICNEKAMFYNKTDYFYY